MADKYPFDESFDQIAHQIHMMFDLREREASCGLTGLWMLPSVRVASIIFRKSETMTLGRLLHRRGFLNRIADKHLVSDAAYESHSR